MDCDVVIVGGALVGTATARALAGARLKLALVDAAAPPAAPTGPFDPRVYAISPGSQALLAEFGAWERLDPDRIAPVERMRVFGDDPRAELTFSAFDAGRAELAWIVEASAIHAALEQTIAGQADLTVLRPDRPADLAWTAEGLQLTTDGGATIRTRLVVGADGAESWVRERAAIPVSRRDYGQQGVVAHFRCELPHHGTAHQWFRPDGVLALLPLPGERVSMVWSAADELAEELKALDPAALAERVTEASAGLLGRLEPESPALGFPLRLIKVRNLAAPRVALVGDAAHAVHPLAGQGVNLGFQDVRELERVLAGREPGRDCGDYRLLRRYERARREDILLMQTATDGLQRLFGRPEPAVAAVRNWGLRLTNGLAPIKARLMQHALG
ncbi:MAG TPA: UbiH/UbiF family hydroxylase [Pelomicrobium sp.]|nr:UbiH/UbiF family hydroxylase [Pelomicrobium sp.]